MSPFSKNLRVFLYFYSFSCGNYSSDTSIRKYLHLSALKVNQVYECIKIIGCNKPELNQDKNFGNVSFLLIYCKRPQFTHHRIRYACFMVSFYFYPSFKCSYVCLLVSNIDCPSYHHFHPLQLSYLIYPPIVPISIKTKHILKTKFPILLSRNSAKN